MDGENRSIAVDVDMVRNAASKYGSRYKGYECFGGEREMLLGLVLIEDSKPINLIMESKQQLHDTRALNGKFADSGVTDLLVNRYAALPLRTPT